VIRLVGGDRSFLSVDDDGVGLHNSRHAAPGAQGMGLLIMGYRAKMIGGSLEVRPGADGGTSVCCKFPASNLEKEAEL
jgi:signal transduction histidine kinase